MRAARRSKAQCRYDGIGPWYAVWRQSRPFPCVHGNGSSPGFTAEKLLDAVADDPRCSRCESGVDGILTPAGEEAMVEMASTVAQAYAIASLEVVAARRQRQAGSS